MRCRGGTRRIWVWPISLPRLSVTLTSHHGTPTQRCLCSVSFFYNYMFGGGRGILFGSCVFCWWVFVFPLLTILFWVFGFVGWFVAAAWVRPKPSSLARSRGRRQAGRLDEWVGGWIDGWIDGSGEAASTGLMRGAESRCGHPFRSHFGHPFIMPSLPPSSSSVGLMPWQPCVAWIDSALTYPLARSRHHHHQASLAHWSSRCVPACLPACLLL